jgi:hypothetical protein
MFDDADVVSDTLDELARLAGMLLSRGEHAKTSEARDLATELFSVVGDAAATLADADRGESWFEAVMDAKAHYDGQHGR